MNCNFHWREEVKKMYQNCCKKCGSTSLHTEQKRSNIGLYCDDCGAWIKWLGKDETRAFEHSQHESREGKPMYINKESDDIKMNNELKEACKPLLEFLYKYGTPHSTVIVTQEDAEFLHGECSTIFELRD
jgi:PHP family Zn ribbon phosphoesterase